MTVIVLAAIFQEFSAEERKIVKKIYVQSWK